FRNIVLAINFLYTSKVIDDLSISQLTMQQNIFSFGCILFSSLTDSLHPFVDEKNCVENIAKNQPSLSEVDHLAETKQLSSGLLNSNPKLW
ncbi:unnamed protein product, partial [Brassica napus]